MGPAWCSLAGSPQEQPAAATIEKIIPKRDAVIGAVGYLFKLKPADQELVGRLARANEHLKSKN